MPRAAPAHRECPIMVVVIILLSPCHLDHPIGSSYNPMRQMLVNLSSILQRRQVKFRDVNDSPRDTLQAGESPKWNPAGLPAKANLRSPLSLTQLCDPGGAAAANEA